LQIFHTGHSFFSNVFPRRVDEILNFNNTLRLYLLIKSLGEINFVPDIIWIYDYKALNVARYFRNKCKTLYFCNDFFGSYAEKYEKKLCELVNCVFTTDPRKQKILSRFSQKSFFLPHGSLPTMLKPSFLKKDRPTILGYIGTINDTLDTVYFQRLLDQTSFRIVIVGPIVECSSEKKFFFLNYFQSERVDYYGDLDLAEREIILTDVDICLLPYHSDVNGFPLKFFDYLNFGKPIVSTLFDFEWPIEYKEFLYFYDGKTDLNDFLLLSYNSWDFNYYEKAVTLSKKSRWSDRIKEVIRILEMDD
jgi:hypothetical protein